MLPAELFASLASNVFVVQSLSREGKLLSFGSGVVVTPGHVVTNKHVVKEGTAIRVKHGKHTWPAKLTHMDPNHDICQLSVENLEAPPVPMRDYSSLVVGERVYAIGAPEGFDLTLSEGLISGLRRRASTDVIQTTAPISHGSSGGGLFDSEGRLIGITTYFIEEGQSLNFALSALLISTLDNYPVSMVTERAGLGGLSEGGSLDLEELALKRFREGKYGEASKLLRKLSGLHPQRAEIWRDLGICYYFLSLYDEANEVLGKSLQLNAESLDAWKWLGHAYSRTKDYGRAIDAYKHATALESEDAYAWIGIGEAFHESGLLSDAQTALERATQAQPDLSIAWRSLGRLAVKRHRYDEAVSAFRKAVQTDPDDAENWYWLAYGYFVQGAAQQLWPTLAKLEVLDRKKAKLFSDTFLCR
jgi:Flp pilus assembly protein TadD